MNITRTVGQRSGGSDMLDQRTAAAGGTAGQSLPGGAYGLDTPGDPLATDLLHWRRAADRCIRRDLDGVSVRRCR